MALKWNFQRGWELKLKNLLWEGYGYFLEQCITFVSMFSECYIFAFCVDYSCSNGCHYVLAVDSVGCLLLCASGTYDSHDTLPVTTWKSFCCAKVRP